MQQHMAITQGIQMAALVHDLKAPVTIAAGAAQMALEAEGKDVRAQLQQILQAMGSIDRILSMMGDEETIEKACTFTGAQLRDELMAMTSACARQKGQRVSMDLGALGDCTFQADCAALSRLLHNLLNNAIKYTPEGGEVTLRAQMDRGWREDQRRIRFIVADNGPGMTQAFIRRMYMPFVRAKETAEQPGSGLGLMIAKEMVKRLDGTIRVHSERGRGTTFVVCVPVKLGKMS